MHAQVQDLLDQFTQSRSDHRKYLCNVSILNVEKKLLILGGEVLDQQTRAELLEEINAHFPDLHVEMNAVKVLSSEQGDYLWSATNLTSMHIEPSWLTEMLTQLLYGTRVEVLKTADNWVLVRRDDGYIGWAYRPYLSTAVPDAPSHLVARPTVKLHEAADKKSKLLSRIFIGTGVSIAKIEGEWAYLLPHRESLPNAFPGGWILQKDLVEMKTLPSTPLEKRNLILKTAYKLYGVPYLWGGCTSNGIDCSGLAQLAHRMAGIPILRDADMQKDAGVPVEYPFAPGDLLFFGDDDDLTRITHVGISLGGWEIIHSSRSRNGVYVDDVQKVDHLRNSFAGACSFIH